MFDHSMPTTLFRVQEPCLNFEASVYVSSVTNGDMFYSLTVCINNIVRQKLGVKHLICIQMKPTGTFTFPLN